MKWLMNLIDWIKRETWWRRRYKRVNIINKIFSSSNCIECSAAKDSKLTCNNLKGRECPCKWYQCLKYRRYGKL